MFIFGLLWQKKSNLLLLYFYSQTKPIKIKEEKDAKFSHEKRVGQSSYTSTGAAVSKSDREKIIIDEMDRKSSSSRSPKSHHSSAAEKSVSSDMKEKEKEKKERAREKERERESKER